MMSLAGRCDVDCDVRLTWAEVRVVTGAMVSTVNTLESWEVKPAPSKAHLLCSQNLRGQIMQPESPRYAVAWSGRLPKFVT